MNETEQDIGRVGEMLVRALCTLAGLIGTSSDRNKDSWSLLAKFPEA